MCLASVLVSAIPPQRVASERRARRRSPLLAAVLSGLGPGAGHAYVGRPARGAVLAALALAAGGFFILAVPISFRAAQLAALPAMILVLALIVDSARLARSAPPSLGPWQRGWIYAAIIVVTGFVLPAAMTWLLGRQVEIVAASDDAMDPALLEGDWAVVEREGDPSRLRRGDVVALRRPGRSPALRRLIGLPGETVSVERGWAEIEGATLPLSLARPMLAERLTLPPVTLSDGQVLALGDRRRVEDAAESVVSRDALFGRASWILLPADHDPLRIGAEP